MSKPTINVSSATTRELREFFNTHTGSDVPPVRRFSDRAAAERRVTELLASLGEKAPKKVAAKKVAAKKVAAKKVAAKKTKTPGRKAPRPVLDPQGTHARRSAGVLASWKDPAVAAKRAQRSNVTVDGVEFRSVRQAFVELGLDLKDHIQFRMLLKEKGSLVDEGRKWVNHPVNY